MLHPSYSDLIEVANSGVEQGEAKVVNSRYSIVMAIAKRARQIIDGDEPLVYAAVDKPLSIAVEELNKGEIKILSEEAYRLIVILGLFSCRKAIIDENFIYFLRL